MQTHTPILHPPTPPHTHVQEPQVELSEVQMWKDTNRLQTQCLPIAPGTTTIRSLDWGRHPCALSFAPSSVSS